MSIPSLGVRLFLLSFVSISLALVATTFVLNTQFQEYFEDRIYRELEQHLEQLTTNLELNAHGDIHVLPLLDRRFEQPFGGLYWQVQEIDGPEISSRSLWGGTFEVPETTVPGQQYKSTSQSPIGTTLLVLGWPILLGEGDTERTALLSVAVDETEVTNAAVGFRKYLIGWLTLMFAGLLIASWAQVRIGLAPLKLLRERLGNIRAGSDTRMVGDFPSEVMPLVDEVNELLELHETSLATARTRASDLAHGLKTPLTVMRALAEDLARDGDEEKAREMEAQIASMHHFVERELARASSSLPTKAPIISGQVVTRMVESIRKMPKGNLLDWNVKVPPNLLTPFDEHDLSELVGNILDNARKMARTRVDVLAGNPSANSGWIQIIDDGPGIPTELVETVLERGGRLGSPGTGAGLGLAISADIAAQKGAKLQFSRSDFGGLKVEILW